jgi:hypothetical protein
MSVFQISSFSVPRPGHCKRKPAPPRAPGGIARPADAACIGTSPWVSNFYDKMKKPLSSNYNSAEPSARIGFLSIALDSVNQNGHPRRPLRCSCSCGLVTRDPGMMNGTCTPGSGRFVASNINRYLMTIDDPLQIFDTSAKYRFWDIRKSDRFSRDSVPRLLTQNYQFNMHMGGTSGPKAWNHLLPVRCSAPQFGSLYIVTRCTAILRRHSRQRYQD